MKKLAIVNLSDRHGAMIRAKVAGKIDASTGSAEPDDVTDLAPGEALMLDRDEFRRLSIEDVPGPAGERFRGERTGEILEPAAPPFFRTQTNGQSDLPVPPAK